MSTSPMSAHPQSGPSVNVIIREFQRGDEEAFKLLNEEWIQRYFRIEPKEVEVLDHPKEKILDVGGRIFFAVIDGACIGCVALRRLSNNEYEVAKMAVRPAHQGAGIGRKLLNAAVAAARTMAARRLYIETNHTLTPAIRLYESVGFRHMLPEEITPSPYVRADVYMEMILN